MKERHTIRVTVEVNKVRLTVRFPCKLTFEMRTCSCEEMQRERGESHPNGTNSN